MPTSTARGQWLTFDKPGELLDALACACDRERCYPATAVGLPNGHLAIELTPDQARAVLAQKGQRGWTVNATPRAAGTPERLVELITADFSRIDLNARALDGTRPPELEYVIGSDTEQNARYVLQLLLGAETRGLRVRPLVTPTTGTNRPYLFWHVQGTPIRPALEAAHRVWCGPVTHTVAGEAVFVEWQYKLNIDPLHLRRLDWQAGNNGLVLLGRDAPRVLTVPVPETAPRFEELAAVAEFRVGHNPTVVAPIAETADPRFPIWLRLVSTVQPQTPAERIRQLELEVRYRTDLIARLQDERVENDPWLPPVYEPVFVYLTPKGTVPDGLRQLLVEWCDQEELRNLRYLRLADGALPLHSGLHGREVHVLATETALTGRPSPDGRSFWLRDYRPADGAVFRVLPEWLNFDLRLFVPDDEKRLSLYPELRPDLYPEFRAGKIAAQRLAEALLPKGVVSNDHLILLINENSPLNANPHLIALPVPVKQFRPLVESLPWECTVEVRPEPGAVTGEAARARKELVAAIGGAFADAVHDAAREPLQRLQKEFVGEIQAINAELEARKQEKAEQVKQFETELGARQEKIDGLNADLAVLEGSLKNASAAIAGARRAFTPLANALSAAGENYATVARLYDEAGRLASTLTTLANEARQMANKYHRLRRSAKPGGGT